MNTMYRKLMQLSVFAVAAVAAVMLLAGGAPAQADTATLAPDGGGGNLFPQQTDPTPPRHATPDPCPGEEGNTTEAAEVVSTGHIALFDVYWNPVEGELTNTVCPPIVEHVPAKPGTPASDNRSPSSIDITAEPPTIIHIPISARVDLSTSTTYTDTEYPAVWAADKKENRDTDGDGTPDDVGDGMVWVLPACPPDGTPSEDGLCISFSAALLNPADWDDNIEYHVDHVHQIDIDKQEPRYVLAYNVPEDGATDENTPLWDSSDARNATMTVAPGGYDRPMWFFTDRGTYEFQVHIKGNTNQDTNRPDGLDPISTDASVTSDVREYILHVGAEADLGVATTVTPESPSPNENVTITIIASNAGPETAPNTNVDVRLPDGLTYSGHTTDTTGTIECPDPDGGPTSTQETYCPGTGVWAVGSLDVTDDQNTATDDDPPTLTITASVDAGTYGETLTTEATIAATEPVQITETVDGVETVKTYDVPVLDPSSSNDMASGAITVASRANEAPMFQITRSVPENSAVGAVVGAAIEVYQHGESNAVTYSLISGEPEFAVASDSKGNAQVTVAQATLDYETNATYHAIIGVSDGLNTAGNPDSTVDNRIAVLVNVTDVDERPSRSIAENSASGSNVGAAVVTGLAGSDPAPTYTLSGDGHDNFNVATDTDGNAQISVSSTAMLDYELRSDYDLFISNDSNSNQVEVLISVTDVTEALNNGAPTVTISAEDSTLTVGDTANLTVSVGDLPAGTVFGSFLWEDNWNRNSNNADADWEMLAQSTDPSYAYDDPANRAETVRFRVIMAYWDGEQTGTIRYATSNIISVEWQEAGSQN